MVPLTPLTLTMCIILKDFESKGGEGLYCHTKKATRQRQRQRRRNNVCEKLGDQPMKQMREHFLVKKGGRREGIMIGGRLI